jgi:hypothetical protein
MRFRPTRRRRLARGPLAALLITMLLVLTQSRPAEAQVITWGHFDFYENRNAANNNLVLKWISIREVDGNLEPARVRGTWRSGSGSSDTRINKNPCRVSKGWLPPGWYDGLFHAGNYNGSRIKGMVWKVQDMPCSNGTRRTDLFIHSEETASRGQSCPTSGDDPFCWEGTGDYYSEGCIKISHASIGNADFVSRSYGGPPLGSGWRNDLLNVHY